MTAPAAGGAPPGAVPQALATLLRGPDFRAMADSWEQAGSVPREDVDKLAGEGLLGLTVGPEYGGTGVPLAEVTEVHRAVAAASPSLHSLLVVHAMVCHALRRWGSTPLRDEFLPELASGAVIGAFGLTERDAGSDFSRIAAELRREEDGTLRVTGSKRWLSFGQSADVFLVFGRTEGAGSCALISRGDGVQVRPERPTTGLAVAGLAELVLEEAPVPASRMVARPGFGLPHVATYCLTLGRLLVGAGAVGVAEEALRLAVARAATRTSGDGVLGERQLVRGLLADAAVAVDAARGYLESAAAQIEDRAPDAPLTAARAKLLASRAAALSTANAVRVLGAEGLDATHPVNRLEQAARVHQVIEGPTEVLQDLVAGGLLREHAARTNGGTAAGAAARQTREGSEA